MTLNMLNKVVALAVLYLSLCACASSSTVSDSIRVIDLNANNTVVYSQQISLYDLDLLSNAIVTKRLFLAHSEKLYLVINSPGGYYEVALILGRFLNGIENLVLLCSRCHSAAGLVFMTSIHPRLVNENSLLMMHEMYDPHATAKAINNKAYRVRFTTKSNEFNRAIADKLKIDVKEYESRIVDSQWVLGGEDIVTNNLADEVVRVNCDVYISNIAPVACGTEDELNFKEE